MYQQTVMRDCFKVRSLVSIHYFEFSKDYHFHGESHDFWELVYLDRGEADIWMDERVVRIRQGEVAFHKPNQWHTIHATGQVAPNIAIVSFDCRSPRMAFFADRVLPMRSAEKAALSTIIHEARQAFVSPLDELYTEKLERGQSRPDCEQMIRLQLEYLLISLYRGNVQLGADTALPLAPTGPPVDAHVNKHRHDREIIEAAVQFMQRNLGQKITFGQVCAFVGVSPSTLKKIFRDRVGKGVIEYAIHLKIDRAKLLIREKSYNFTQIAHLLGYDTLHHFSRQFRQHTGMSPSEYAQSVKALTDQALGDKQ